MTIPSKPPVKRLKIVHRAESDPAIPSYNVPTGSGESQGRPQTMEEMRKAINNLADHRKEQSVRESEFFFATIVTNPPVNKIPESMFVNEMLPFLFEEIPDFAKDDPTLQMTSAKWIAAAGGPYAEFDVIDAAGVVLFRCPPYMNREMYDIKQAAAKGRLSGVFVHTKQLSHMAPVRAAAFSTAQFTDRGYSMNRDAVIDEVQARWNEIFKRYNRPQLVFDKQENAPALIEGSKSTGASGTVDSTPDEYTNDGFEC